MVVAGAPSMCVEAEVMGAAEWCRRPRLEVVVVVEDGARNGAVAVAVDASTMALVVPALPHSASCSWRLQRSHT